MRNRNPPADLHRGPNEGAMLRDNIQRLTVLHRSHGNHTLPNTVEHFAVLRFVAPKGTKIGRPKAKGADRRHESVLVLKKDFYCCQKRLLLSTSQATAGVPKTDVHFGPNFSKRLYPLSKDCPHVLCGHHPQFLILGQLWQW